MEEYSEHLIKFSFEGAGRFSKDPRPEAANMTSSRSYLEKYWLTKKEYEAKWKPIHMSIFTGLYVSLPDLVFQKGYDFLVLRGGCLFNKEDFESLQHCLKDMGETHFVIIENTFEGNLDEPTFRMKYPIDIEWSELMNGNFISSTIFENMYKEFFVFSESGKWGKYAASDYEQPLDIIGFKPDYESVFRKNFDQLPEEWEEIKEWLPPKYKEIVK